MTVRSKRHPKGVASRVVVVLVVVLITLLGLAGAVLVLVRALNGVDITFVWLGILWAVVVVGVTLGARLRPVSARAAAEVAAARAAPSEQKDKRIGRTVGWFLVVSTIVFAPGLLLIPRIAGLIAMLSWTKEYRVACSADPSCVISVLPVPVLPVALAWVWVAVIAAALVICWRPARWWLPAAEARRHDRVLIYTSPDWIRIHAFVAAVVAFLCVGGTSELASEITAPEYCWVVLAALTVATASTVCIKMYGFVTPLDVTQSLALTVSARSGIFDRRWRAAQRELHPRQGSKRGAPDA